MTIDNNEPYFMGIDSGLTVLKAVIFDSQGNEIAYAREKTPLIRTGPRFIERDMNLLWELTKKVIREVLKLASIDPKKIISVGVSGHGDGLYLLDESYKPIRNAITSLDSRAFTVLSEWKKEGILDQLYPIIGQYPTEGSPLPLLAWIKRNEPEVFKRIRWVIFCKDYIKFKLTGRLCTDKTDASATLINYRTGHPDSEIYELTGLQHCDGFIPEIIDGWQICGTISRESSLETGLNKETIVASGLHDIDATALGSGCLNHGDTCIIVGTWGINEVISSEPILDPSRKCLTRIYGAPNKWLIIFVNYTKTAGAGLEWFIKECGKDLEKFAEEQSIDKYKLCDEEAAGIAPGSEGVIFIPFLEGAVGIPEARAVFYGLTAHHKRAHLIKAILEGVSFATKLSLIELSRLVSISEIRMAGGGSRSPLWPQIMADVLGIDIKVPEGTELGAKGAAICAAIASGFYKNHEEALRNMTRIGKLYNVDYRNKKEYEELYQKFLKIMTLLYEK